MVSAVQFIHRLTKMPAVTLDPDPDCSESL